MPRFVKIGIDESRDFVSSAPLNQLRETPTWSMLQRYHIMGWLVHPR